MGGFQEQKKAQQLSIPESRILRGVERLLCWFVEELARACGVAVVAGAPTPVPTVLWEKEVPLGFLPGQSFHLCA